MFSSGSRTSIVIKPNRRLNACQVIPSIHLHYKIPSHIKAPKLGRRYCSEFKIISPLELAHSVPHPTY
uniref:Uncharacterized protein n=1 Tax=Picea glauca TaxID=3330 RepID=A0A124GMS5_PICGL|nr:hypothetical protein ABT39_MTgene1684 [Picea glauca]QHR86860.1 hypothetical protein Q903MT_gene867 [Picea sitchensis]